MKHLSIILSAVPAVVFSLVASDPPVSEQDYGAMIQQQLQQQFMNQQMQNGIVQQNMQNPQIQARYQN